MVAKALPATFQDILDLERRTGKNYELYDGEIVEKAGGSFEHGTAQAHLSTWVHSHFGRRVPADPPTGWYLALETNVELWPGRVVIPDLAGWRRDRTTLEKLKPRPVTVRPDWICEILSPSNSTNDTVVKVAYYKQAKVSHYWLLDPIQRTLVVYRWTEQGYLLVLSADARETVRPEPFEDVELPLASLFASDE